MQCSTSFPLENFRQPLDYWAACWTQSTWRYLLNAPIDEEPLTPEEEQALAESHEWRKHNEPTPQDVVLTELGITAEEIEIYREPV